MLIWKIDRMYISGY